MVKKIIAICSLVGLFFTAFFIMDERHAHSKGMTELQNKVAGLDRQHQQFVWENTITEYRKRIWMLQDRYRGSILPIDAVEQVRWLKEEIRKLQDRINRLGA